MIASVCKGDAGINCVRIPASKSLSHRLLIAAALAEGTSVIQGIVLNADVSATIDCLRLLGAKISVDNDTVTVEGISDFLKYDGSMVFCGESGSTLRFLLPLFAQSGKICLFSGSGRLMERPMEIYEKIYDAVGSFSLKKNILRVQGPISAGQYTLKGNISSQFISGLLFLLPLLEGDSEIEVLPPVESLSYIDLTIDVLRLAGISAERQENIITVWGNQKYMPIQGSVKGDDSQAAFFIVYSLLSQKVISIDNMAHDSLQGDHVILDIVERCGSSFEETDNGYRILPGELRAFEADLGDCPDLGPILFVLASQCNGRSRFTHVQRLRIKESDRIESMREELMKAGIVMETTEDEVWISGPQKPLENVILDGHNDHRIVMALSILAAICRKGMKISGAEAIHKSYPDFYTDLRKCGVNIETEQENKSC